MKPNFHFTDEPKASQSGFFEVLNFSEMEIPLKVREDYTWFCLELYLECSPFWKCVALKDLLVLSAFGAMLSGDSTRRCRHQTSSLGLLGSQAHAVMYYFINDSPLYHRLDYLWISFQV